MSQEPWRLAYKYNGRNQRVYKSGPTAMVNTGAAYFLYDEQGQLLGEYDTNGAPVYETVYLGSLPVGVLKQTGTAANSDISTTVYNVHADHIATARIITQQDQTIVWRWDTAEAFGGTAPDQNPGSLGTFVYNQRFPGQVFDSETGLFQNWNREYNARQGRYIQSDPIGLAGGINTFAYVSGDPLRLSDPWGLRPLTPQEKAALRPYISEEDLNNADVHVGEMPWYAQDWVTGITRGNDIYFRNPEQTFCSSEDLALLGHELVHVGQYRQGMTWLSYLWASRNGYHNSPYEVEAYDLHRKIQSELKSKDCSCKN